MTITLVAVYADGWDGAVVNPMIRSFAEARDAAGKPYAVLLLAAGRLHSLVHVSWRDGYCHVTGFDGRGRTVSRWDLRGTAEGDLFLYEKRTWVGPDEVSEFEFPHVAARHYTRHQLDGRRVDVDEPHGDRGGGARTESFELPPRLSRPRFGQWQGLLAFIGHGGVIVADAEHHPLSVKAAPVPPWRPPRPLAPGDVGALFVAGAEHTVAGRVARIELHQAGKLSMPSGRLVAADPSSLDFDREPYTVTVGPWHLSGDGEPGAVRRRPAAHAHRRSSTGDRRWSGRGLGDGPARRPGSAGVGLPVLLRLRCRCGDGPVSSTRRSASGWSTCGRTWTVLSSSGS